MPSFLASEAVGRRMFLAAAAATAVVGPAAPSAAFGVRVEGGHGLFEKDNEMLGVRRIGDGAVKAIVMNDWIGDTTTWDPSLPYLDQHAIEWIFADLRGYGRSRHLAGPFDALQSASDIAALAEALGVTRFVIVGHSMSSIVAVHLAQSRPELVRGVVLITPPPFTGGAPAHIIEGAKAIALADDHGRREALRQMWGDRLSKEWIDFKVARWREAAIPEAVADYVEMFAGVGLPRGVTPVAAPVVAIAGEVDPNPMMRPAAVSDALSAISPGARLISIADAGHYPMQEAPPLFAKLVAEAVTGIAASA